jgi:uncharacterized protein YgiB involved in biofilm formation
MGGLAVAAGMSLGGCDSTPDFQSAEFTTVKECVSAGFPSDLCDAGFKSALEQHQQTAPKFNSLKSCEEEWGGNHCLADATPATATTPATSASSSGGSVFVPMLAGFVVSQALQKRYYNDGGINYYGGYYGSYGSPIYRNRTGSTVTVNRSSGRAVATPVNVNTRSVAHSGFGGMSMSRSSGGGSFGG